MSYKYYTIVRKAKIAEWNCTVLTESVPHPLEQIFCLLVRIHTVHRLSSKKKNKRKLNVSRKFGIPVQARIFEMMIIHVRIKILQKIDTCV